MDKGYEMLLGRPQPANGGTGGPDAGPREPFGWDDADGDGPDRLFNRYRRLRLEAWAAAATEATVRCPAMPSAVRA